ncbi:hypothetical protein EVAR_37906_1 [Eumeta japonica]|uniref:Uncharacterized protein n=1 Tax=Eumeta variegata TaxID=151549 RepID=A0A4C1XC00_EUMVA|nr:hypothetical protein EVAR_37906_1 [Eumeta japonica]
MLVECERSSSGDHEKEDETWDGLPLGRAFHLALLSISIRTYLLYGQLAVIPVPYNYLFDAGVPIRRVSEGLRAQIKRRTDGEPSPASETCGLRPAIIERGRPVWRFRTFR